MSSNCSGCCVSCCSSSSSSYFLLSLELLFRVQGIACCLLFVAWKQPPLGLCFSCAWALWVCCFISWLFSFSSPLVQVLPFLRFLFSCFYFIKLFMFVFSMFSLADFLCLFLSCTFSCRRSAKCLWTPGCMGAYIFFAFCHNRGVWATTHAGPCNTVF